MRRFLFVFRVEKAALYSGMMETDNYLNRNFFLNNH